MGECGAAVPWTDNAVLLPFPWRDGTKERPCSIHAVLHVPGIFILRNKQAYSRQSFLEANGDGWESQLLILSVAFGHQLLCDAHCHKSLP